MEDQKQEDRIRRRAYELWEREGSPVGRAEEFWQRAIVTLGRETSPEIGGQGVIADVNAAAASGESKREAPTASG